MANDKCNYTGICIALSTLIYFNPESSDLEDLRRTLSSELNMSCYHTSSEEFKKCPAYGVMEAIQKTGDYALTLKAK